MRRASPLSARRCTLRCRTSPRRRWPGAVALVMWNMRKRHFSHCCKTAAARIAVKGAPLSSAFIEAKRRPLTATAAEATRVSAPGCPFSLDPLLSTRLQESAPQRARRLPTSTRVFVCKRDPAKLMIFKMFTHVNTGARRALHSYPVGDDVSPLHPLRSSAGRSRPGQRRRTDAERWPDLARTGPDTVRAAFDFRSMTGREPAPLSRQA
jgi:hypothetical protein